MKWIPVHDYESIYEVNEFGVIRRIDNKKTITPYPNSRGYLNVFLRKPREKRKHLYVHRVVTKAFIPNTNNYPCVNHIDGNKKNNHVSNLEWCTYSQNSQHAWDNNLIPRERTEQAKQNMRIAQQNYFKYHDPWNKGKQLREYAGEKNFDKVCETFHKGAEL